MTSDEFYDAYEAMLDTAHEGFQVCVLPLEGTAEKLGIVALPIPPQAQLAAEKFDDDELLELTTTLLVKSRRIADKMVEAGIDSYDGPEED